MQTVVQFFIFDPLRVLFLRGPSMLGFWGGAAVSDICASMTQVAASFWDQHPAQCLDIIDQKVDTLLVGIVFLFCVMVVYRVLTAITFHVCFTRPVIQEIRHLLTHTTPHHTAALQSISK